MRIFICSSKHQYWRIPEIASVLENNGHKLTMPNSYDDPFKEMELKKLGGNEHSEWKREMLLRDEENIRGQDAILVLNFTRDTQPFFFNYIGGATLLEAYTAFRLGKKIFLYNPLPSHFCGDELVGMGAIVINGDLSLVC